LAISEIALSGARTTNGKTQQRTKQARARLPIAIATNLLLFVLSTLPHLLIHYHYNNHIAHRRQEVRQLNITESRPSTRANMAQPDISSILAALGKCAHATQ
jgi:hypothetical protein